MKRRLLIAFAGAVVTAFGLAAPAAASTAGTSIACTNYPGHYCAKVYYTPAKGGVYVNETSSTGYTEGRGSATEWYLYTCASGVCKTAPSSTFHYTSSDVQLNVIRHFAGSGFFQPCNSRFGVAYSGTNTPDGIVQFRVVCSSGGVSVTG